MKPQDKGESIAMYRTTKQKIAGTLRQMMMERPFQKITVQNLMDASGMKRQSFYYHFQDTRDVLWWICDQEVVQPLKNSGLDFEPWILYGMELLNRDRPFFRRVAAVSDPESIQQLGEDVLGPRIATEELGQLNDGQVFCVRFGTKAVVACALELVNSRQGLDLAAAQANVRCLMETIGLQGGGKVT